MTDYQKTRKSITHASSKITITNTTSTCQVVECGMVDPVKQFAIIMCLWQQSRITVAYDNL